MSWEDFWKTLIFSDKFTGISSEETNIFFLKRQGGGRSITVCASLGFKKKRYRTFKQSKYTRCYQKVLNKHLLLVSEEIGGNALCFNKTMLRIILQVLRLSGFYRIIRALLASLL